MRHPTSSHLARVTIGSQRRTTTVHIPPSVTLSKNYFSCSSMGVRQNPWTPTKRRGPIAAEAASPGPAVVSLPSLIGKPPPESRKLRAPAFTFGQKLEPVGTSKVGPGPASYNTEGMTAKGRATGPAVSLHGRWPPPRVALTPAPCDYESSKAARAVLDHAPAFSIGLRVSPPQPGSQTPAPNIYSMPPVLGEAKEGSKRAAPAFSIIGRGKEIESKSPIPGPGTYTTDKAALVLNKKPPAYSMAPRREIKQPTAAIPGPGVYCPEKADSILREKSPKFSFTGKLKVERIQNVPAPNAYNPDKADRILREKSPAYSFRTKTDVKKVHDAPAPNLYSPEKSLHVLKSGPKYTLAGKGVAEKHEITPAPNSYNPQKADKILHESSPAYTMRSKDVIEKMEETPAPNVYTPEKSINLLNSGPKFTILGKSESIKISETPAPNSYNPEKATKVLHEASPAYSFRIKEKYISRSDSPAPNTYAPEKSIRMLDHSPKFTISGKGPSNKIDNLPGPNVYCPDKADKLLHESSPSYSFRIKDHLKHTDITPAPNAYNTEKSINALDNSPKFTMAGKGQPTKMDNMPAPNSYNLDKTDKLLYESAPAFSFRPKNCLDKPNDTPAPNKYDPQLLNGAPKFSLYGKGCDNKPSDTPGPNAYDPQLIDGAPKYSILGKGSESKPSDIPAPNAYNPILSNKSPKYTFSGRAPEEKPLDTPGPNNYNPHVASNAPRFTIAGKGPEEKPSDTPGPNTYNSNLPSSSPKYTISGKGQPNKVIDTPGPNAYSPEKAVNLTLEHSPAYTFRSKHPVSHSLDTPAPNSYDPSNYTSENVPKYSFGIKGPNEKPSNNPAPNVYSPEKADKVLHESSPAFTFRPRIEINKINDTPAPNVYNPDKADKILLDNAPRYSFRIKTSPHTLDNIPAPNSYNPDKADKVLMPSAPQYTFRIKSDSLKVLDTPAPNSYNIPAPVKTPLYTISGRHKEPIDERLKVPSPGTYNPEKAFNYVLTYSPQYTFGIKIQTDKYADSPAPNAYRIPSVLDTPVYTFSGRHKVPTDDRVRVPAPGTYSPEKVQLSKPPQITFGIKHSPRLGQLKSIQPQEPVENDLIKDMSRRVTEIPKNIALKSQKTENVNIKINNSNESVLNNETIQNYIDNSNESSVNVYNTHTHITNLRSPNEVKSRTTSPELVQETLAREIVWVPENLTRRGSYTIDKDDGGGSFERYERNEIIPTDGGCIQTHESGEQGGSNINKSTRETIVKDGYQQVTDRSVHNTSAFENKNADSQEMYTDTDVKHLPNGGISKTTTTKTIRKVGTAARTANATTNVTRTNVAVTSRDVGAK